MKKIFLSFLFVFFFLFLLPPHLSAQTNAANNGILQISVQTGKGTVGDLSISLQLLLLFTILSVAPAILIMMTSFVRIIIVFSFLRTGLSVQEPSNQILISLALFLTFFIMAPTFQAIYNDAYLPMKAGKIETEQALEIGGNTFKKFMLHYVREKDLRLFISMSPTPLTLTVPEDLPLSVVIPSFMLSELQTGFRMGLLILLPFLVIDLVMACILTSLGMMMLPPTLISLPIKLMVFLLVDGWTLIIRSLLASFQT